LIDRFIDHSLALPVLGSRIRFDRLLRILDLGSHAQPNRRSVLAEDEGHIARRRLHDDNAWSRTMRVRLNGSCCSMQICISACMKIPISPPGHNSNRKQEPRSSPKADSPICRSLALPESFWATRVLYKCSTSPLSGAAHAHACTIVQ
jgi:hypothetical protein